MSVAAVGVMGSGRLYRNAFLLHSVYTVFGYMFIFGSFIAPIHWDAIGLGIASVVSSQAFWTIVDMEFFPDSRRLSLAHYCMAAAPVPMTAITLVRGGFDWSMLYWLVTPAAFAWFAHRRCRATSSVADPPTSLQ
jgi:hypothetical protein